MSADAHFTCQACDFETTLAARADQHEVAKPGHEVFEFFSPATEATS